MDIHTKRLIRAAADARSNCPIEVIDGIAAPMVTGETYYWETQGGTRVQYPAAYCRVARSARLRYVSSSIRVVVGAGWVSENLR